MMTFLKTQIFDLANHDSQQQYCKGFQQICINEKVKDFATEFWILDIRFSLQTINKLR